MHHPPSRVVDADPGKGVLRPRALQIFHRHVDTLGQVVMGDDADHRQRGRTLHETGQHPAMDRPDHRIADVLFGKGQPIDDLAVDVLLDADADVIGIGDRIDPLIGTVLIQQK